MSQESASDAAVLSTDPEKDLDTEPAMYEKYAITVPFGRDTVRCTCKSEAWDEIPKGCKDCAPVSALAKLKSEAIEQTKRRWAWFSAAREQDDELNTRLGTLGYFPLEIRLDIFRHVLEDYMEEVLLYHKYGSPFGYQYFDYYQLEHPVSDDCLSVPGWEPIRYRFKERHIEIIDTIRAHEPEYPKLYDIFSLQLHDKDWVEPAFAMDLRLSTIDIKLEFEYIFFSTMTFRFSCQKALRHFIKQLSPIQLSQMRSIIIEITACYGCYCEGIECDYKSWGSVCSLLPSTLKSIRFEPGFNGMVPRFDGRRYRPTEATDRFRIEDNKRAKHALEFLSCRVRHIAPEAEVTMTERRYTVGRTWDILDAVVRETDPWSKEYIEWKKGLDSSD